VLKVSSKPLPAKEKANYLVVRKRGTPPGGGGKRYGWSGDNDSSSLRASIITPSPLYQIQENCIGTWPSGQMAKTLASLPDGLCRLPLCPLFMRSPQTPRRGSRYCGCHLSCIYVRQASPSDAGASPRIKSTYVKCGPSLVRPTATPQVT